MLYPSKTKMAMTFINHKMAIFLLKNQSERCNFRKIQLSSADSTRSFSAAICTGTAAQMPKNKSGYFNKPKNAARNSNSSSFSPAR
jgi:hypothetical protein